jgi:hypothetical protein
MACIRLTHSHFFFKDIFTFTLLRIYDVLKNTTIVKVKELIKFKKDKVFKIKIKY